MSYPHNQRNHPEDIGNISQMLDDNLSESPAHMTCSSSVDVPPHMKGLMENEAGEGMSRIPPKDAGTSEDTLQDLTYIVMRTVGLYYAGLGVGLVIGVLGPTLLELQRISSASVSQAALLFTWCGVGRIVGSLLSTITFSKFSQVFQLGVALLVLCVTQLVLPWCSHYPVQAIVMSVVGMCLGFYVGTVTTCWFHIWGRKAPPFVQASGFVISCGCTVAPLLAKPFLTELKSSNAIAPSSSVEVHQEFDETSDRTSFHLMLQNKTPLSSRLSGNETYPYSDREDDGIPKVFFTYAVVAAYLAPAVCYFIYLVVRDGCKIKTNRSTKGGNQFSTATYCTKTIVPYVLSTFCTCGLEVTYGGLVMVYVVDFLGWDQNEGATITFAYWLTMAIGRGLAIPVVRIFPISAMVLVNIILSLVSLLWLAFGYDLHYTVVWIFSCTLGFSLSSNVGNILSLACQNHGITGPGSSLIMTGGFVGMLTVPGVTGLLMQHIHPLSFNYCLLVISAAFLFLFPFIRSKSKHNDSFNLDSVDSNTYSFG